MNPPLFNVARADGSVLLLADATSPAAERTAGIERTSEIERAPEREGAPEIERAPETERTAQVERAAEIERAPESSAGRFAAMVANTAAAAATSAASAVSSTAASAVSSTANAVATMAAAVASSAAAVASSTAAVASGTSMPLRRAPVPAPKGDRNENPADISFVALLREDFRTHKSSLLSPGFWAVAVHRFGNWRMGMRKPVRAPLTIVYKAAHYSVTWFFGIDLPYTAKLGRRVRLGHHGCMHLGARAIGNDVYIRHSATIGLLDPKERWAKPTIGDRVEIGPGACVLGDIVVGHDTIIGANTVLGEDVPPHSRVLGNPARHVDFAKLAEAPPAAKRR